MNLTGWLITLIPLCAIVGLAFHCRRYVRGVSDFIACGRVCGRYVLIMGSLEESLSVLTFVALVQQYMHTGVAFEFWNSAYLPLGIFLGLVGFCSYRFRETKALSLGQFIEMRYSKRLRFIASALRVTAEILTNSIGPAVAVRFFIYFLGLNPLITVFGTTFPTYWLLICLVVILAVTVAVSGGQVSLIVTGCCQALISYPIFVIFSVFILINFSWQGDILPVLMDRASGESFLNPYDIENLRDFNAFLLFVTLLQSVLYRANWLFGGNTAAKSAHEGKMGGLLGTWCSGFAGVSIILLAIAILTFMCSPNFARKACEVRSEIGSKLAVELISDPKVRNDVIARSNSAKPEFHDFEKSKTDPSNRFSQQSNPEQHYLGGIRETLVRSMTSGDMPADIRSDRESEAKEIFAQFQSFYSQMVGPAALRKMLPGALMGLMTLLMFMLMLSTDDSRIFNSTVGIVQDLVVPLHKKVMSPRAHLLWLRGTIIFVGVMFIVGSLFLAQLEYLRMFLMIMSGLWNAGASPIMIGGFYFRFGNTAGAYASLGVGFFTTFGSLLLRNNWAGTVYPFLDRHELVGAVGHVLEMISSPLHPFVVWKMSDINCPVNAIEFTFIAMALSWTAYIGVSLLTFKKPYNLERALHRGKYSDDPNKKPVFVWEWRTMWKNFIGITPEYTRGDRILAWSIFGYGIVYQFLLLFVFVVIWNAVSPWPLEWWGHFFWIKTVIVQIAIGTVTTVWFFIGGAAGMRQMFRDLAARKEDPLDNGQIADNGVSLSDKAEFDRIDSQKTETPNK